MPKSSEKGNNMNVVSFDLLRRDLETMSELYAPSRKALQLPALADLYQQAHACIEQTAQCEMQKRALSIKFDTEMKKLPSSITRIKNFIKATDAHAAVKDGAYSLATQITGRASAKKKLETAAEMADGTIKEAPAHHTQSHSTNSILENMGRFLAYLATIPEYAPSVPEYSLASLQSKHADLTSQYLNLKNLERDLILARNRRDELLYTDTAGLVDIAAAVKAEIKATFGATSPQYKLISKYKFIKYKN